MSITVPLYGFGGGGGAALNFKVAGNPQPTSPKENTIWIDTDVPITGYYFAAKQPENMAEGEVWISTGTASAVEFNALKKHAVQVYPLSAKQQVGGVLVDKTAKSYQNGEWVDWIVYLFKEGNEYEEVTGGWLRDPPDQYWTGGSINDAGNMYMTGYRQMFCTGNKINKNNLKTLCVKVENVKQNADPSARIALVDTKYASGPLIAFLAPSAPGVARLDLSSIDQDFYIVTYTYFTGELLEISEMWYE